MRGYSVVGALAAHEGDSSLRVTRLSLDDVSFHAGGRALVPGERLQLSLGELDPIVATVASVEGAEVTADFGRLDVDGARELARLIDRLLAKRVLRGEPPRFNEREVIRAPERIRDILRSLFANRCRGRLRKLGQHDDAGLRLMAARLEPESELPLQWELEDGWIDPPFMFTVDDYMSLVQFRVERAAPVDGFLAVGIPNELERVRSRWQRRVPAPADVFIAFHHPRWPDMHVRRAVRNVSLDGISCSASAVKDLLYPGLELGTVNVIWQDRLVCRARAEVRYVSEDIDGPAQLAGLALEFTEPDERAHWRERIDRLLYPNTRLDGTWSEPLWDLYGHSGYFGISQKSLSDFRPLKQAFSSVSARLARVPDVGCQIVWPSSRGVEASITGLRIYEHTTVLYALARHPGRVPIRFPGREILRDLYLHTIEHLQETPGLRWLIGWSQRDSHFTRLVHLQLAERYRDSGRTAIFTFRAMEGVSAPDRPTAALPAGVQVAPATNPEIDQLLAVVVKQRPAIYAQAHDLLPAQFDQRELRERWGRGGFSRDRAVLVARLAGQPMAAAVMESADDGLHLFHLLDLVRLFPLVDGGERLFPVLLDQVRPWFAKRGKAKFIYSLENGDVEQATRAGLKDLGEADTSFLPVDLLPELVEQLFEITAPRDIPRLRPA
ncbi:MAG TPA: hypothetical protein VFF06_25345 [Polyangia bacterium]|nr:hypothetical protein [Polyangia bacterium]